MEIKEVNPLDFIKFLIDFLSKKDIQKLKEFLDEKNGLSEKKSTNCSFQDKPIICILEKARKEEKKVWKHQCFTRMINQLKNHPEIKTVEDFLKKPKTELLKWKFIGPKTVDTIFHFLKNKIS